jgi:hypothetical protein
VGWSGGWPSVRIGLVWWVQLFGTVAFGVSLGAVAGIWRRYYSGAPISRGSRAYMYGLFAVGFALEALQVWALVAGTGP